MQMPHPKYPKVFIPAARVMGIGRMPALPAKKLYPGDILVLDYGKTYRLQKKIALAPQKLQLYMTASDGETARRIVASNANVAVSWGTFDKHWAAPTTNGGRKTMAQKKNFNMRGKVPLAKPIDLHTPINTGVSFNGKVNLTKQGRSPRVKKLKY